MLQLGLTAAWGNKQEAQTHANTHTHTHTHTHTVGCISSETPDVVITILIGKEVNNNNNNINHVHEGLGVFPVP